MVFALLVRDLVLNLMVVGRRFDRTLVGVGWVRSARLIRVIVAVMASPVLDLTQTSESLARAAGSSVLPFRGCTIREYFLHCLFSAIVEERSSCAIGPRTSLDRGICPVFDHERTSRLGFSRYYSLPLQQRSIEHRPELANRLIQLRPICSRE